MEKISNFSKELLTSSDCKALYICAAGFEDRVRGIVENISSDKKYFQYSIVLEYESETDQKKNARPKGNLLTITEESFHDENRKNVIFLKGALSSLSSEIFPVIVDIDNMLVTKTNLKKVLTPLSSVNLDKIFIDISGMANFLILLTLHQIRKLFPETEIYILYSEALTYFPEETEASEIVKMAESKDERDILALGKKLGASGARETFILPDYKGYFKEDLSTCLIFFVGFEPSRAIGLLDGYRPNFVVACYGVSPHEQFKWRTELSVALHSILHVFKRYENSQEQVSTFDIDSIISKLNEIYLSSDFNGKRLYENYNIAITPQCSKLQTVATYLFCQSHPDIQVVFCLPGSFNPNRYSIGIGKKWVYKMPS